jgi:hypothetical protein
MTRRDEPTAPLNPWKVVVVGWLIMWVLSPPLDRIAGWRHADFEARNGDLVVAHVCPKGALCNRLPLALTIRAITKQEPTA